MTKTHTNFPYFKGFDHGGGISEYGWDSPGVIPGRDLGPKFPRGFGFKKIALKRGFNTMEPFDGPGSRFDWNLGLLREGEQTPETQEK